MNDVTVTMVGNVASEPLPRQVAPGLAVASFRFASTPRRFDRGSNEWKDGETIWASVNCWRALADSVCASVHKGDPVVVTGRLVVRAFDTREGEHRSGLEVEASTVGHDLCRGTATFQRTPRTPPATEPATDSADPWVTPLAGAGEQQAPAA